MPNPRHENLLPRGEGGPEAKRPGRVGIRTCVACRQEAGKATLVRVVRDAAGAAVIDSSGRAPGRGAYLHRDPDCLQNARRRKALDRALKATVSPDFWVALGT